jgi:hydroxymethylglutaryl-CoA reductase (NADPH)
MSQDLNLKNINNVTDRRSSVEDALKIKLTNIGKFSLDESIASTRNCENMIGVTQIPLGIAGQLSLKTTNHEPITNNYYIPLATTEGALVASVNRGCKAITQSGGANVLTNRVGATRGPVFKVRDMAENSRLFDFIRENQPEFNRIAQTTSSHIALTNVETNSVGLYRFVRLYFDTQDAMGLNMVTIASDKIARFIEDKTHAICVSLSGNYCVDKKPAWINFTHYRGIEVWADALLTAQVIHDTLKTSSAKIYETWLAKCMIGSAISGSMGFNAQYANILAAMFIATGQDPAHVAECSIGITTTEIRNDDLYISIYLPDLMVGTVGGGTGLATQKEALSILGIMGGDNGNNAIKLAEIIGGSVLAGEISLLASLSVGTLAQSHQRLGRGIKK